MLVVSTHPLSVGPLDLFRPALLWATPESAQRVARELAARTSGPPDYPELDRLLSSCLSEGYIYYYNSFGRPQPVPVGFRGDVSISRQTMLLRGGATLMNSSRDSHGMPPPPARWTEAGVWGVIVRAEGWDESTHMLEAFVLTGSVGRLFLQVLLVVASARPQACYGPSTSLLFGV